MWLLWPAKPSSRARSRFQSRSKGRPGCVDRGGWSMVKVKANRWRSALRPRLTWHAAAQRAQRVWRISSKAQLSSSAARVGPGASRPRKFLSDAPARDLQRKSGRPDLRSHASNHPGAVRSRKPRVLVRAAMLVLGRMYVAEPQRSGDRRPKLTDAVEKVGDRQ